MRLRIVVGLVLSVTCLACPSGDSGTIGGGGCPVGQTCGFDDHKYFATYVCGGMGVGFSWRDQSRCQEQCSSAASWGCDASGCNCSVDHGTGAWYPCDAANGGEVRSGRCFLSGSGTNGETVDCVCR